MSSMKKVFLVFPAIFILGLAASFSGCDAKPSAKADAVAVVNGTAIDKQEFEKELTLRAAQDPSFKMTPETLADQLDMMINRKLLIEEAIHRKLSEDDRFKTSIRIFWEQTLIRLLMDHLSKEFEPAPSSEGEIKDYYSKLAYKVSLEIKRNKDHSLIKNLLLSANKGEPVEWDERIGPVTFDELNSSLLEQAFELNQGGYGVYEEAGISYLIHVTAKEAVTPPALESIRDKIQGKIKLRKQADAFENWFKEKKQKADIKLMNPEDFNERSPSDLSKPAA